ncbi:uncharacterized protein [Physcomitrium patens]|uniref:uncharacterized protein isoform X2 n=1 Tax=Physcomitrium patens TaxID=3218 RepID=UPI000D157E95|nr:EEF1A lysine methyltransferase 4-like isoform X2 [Physcomitrium patens]|eukprot:XP_024374267.1 EEF1A lysine methyltransferase 4-like isoform X2 [Physcomitrella patens]
MAIRDNTENYFDEAYWNSRYTQDAGPFDWYQQYEGIAPVIKMHSQPSDRVLMVGCGSALLSEEMVKDGYEKIVNIDISDVIIQCMAKKYKHVKQLTYKRMDVRCMSEFKEGRFGCVLDKGLLDNLMVRIILIFMLRNGSFQHCGAGGQASVSTMLSEVLRVLKPGGKYILITYGDPQCRLPYLETSFPSPSRIEVHVKPRPKSKSHVADPPRKISEPFIIQKDLNLGPLFDFQLTNLHYVYICIKVDHRNQNYYSTYMLSRLCSLSGALPFSNIMRE